MLPEVPIFLAIQAVSYDLMQLTPSLPDLREGSSITQCGIFLGHTQVWLQGDTVQCLACKALVTSNTMSQKEEVKKTPLTHIKPSFLFGVRSGVHGGVYFSEDQTLLYPAGSGVARVQVTTTKQDVVALTSKGTHITALVLNENRNLIAFTEYGDRPLLVVYDLEKMKRLKILRCAEFKSHDVVSLAFSHDSKYLLAQGGAPDYQLVYFFWEKGKVVTTARTVNQSLGGSVNSVSFHPKDRDIVCIVGKGIFKMCKLIEGNLKPYGFIKGDSLNCLAHSWLSNKHVLVATERGKVLLFEEAELKTTYSIQELVKETDEDFLDDEIEEEREISALITFSGGFICSYGNNAVYIVEQVPAEGDDMIFKGSRKIVFPKSVIESENGYSIKSLCLSPKEDLLVALTEDLLLYSFPMKKKENTPLKKNIFSIFLYPFHSAGIRGLDICYRKPLIVTGSDDHTIRVWNYKFFGMELAKKFQEDIYSIAIHPDGLYIASGFVDKIRLLNILIDDLRLFHEFPVRECRVCLFSHGGHLLVASVKDTIHIYNTITFQTIHILKGHQGEVTSVCWSVDDLKLVSCADNGSVYEWNISTGERIHEVVVKTCPFSYLALSPDSTTTYAVGADKTVKQMCKSSIVQEIDLHSFELSSICLSPNGKILVSGSSTGAIQLFDFPLSLPGKWREWKLHGDAINFIKITHTNDTLITGSKDGSFCVWDISTEEKTKDTEPYNYAVEILITKTELEEKNNLIEDLKQKVDESKTECAYQLRLKDNQNADMLKEVNKKTLIEKQGMKSQISSLSLEIEALKKGRLTETEDLKKQNERAMIDQSDVFKSKLVTEYDRYDNLESEYNMMKDASVKKVEELEKSIEQRVEKIKREFDNKLSIYEEEVKTRERRNEEKIKSMEEILKQTEEDADKEILEMKTKYEKDLKHERETLVKVRGELGILKKKHFNSQRDLESQKDDLDWMGKEQIRFKNEIRINEKDKGDLKKEMKGRDNTILEKEKEISKLKRELRHMENSKYVFQHKIMVLQEEIKPKEEKIEDMKQQILDMERELTKSVKEKSDNVAQIDDVKAKLSTASQDLVIEKRKVGQIQSSLAKILSDLACLQPVLQDTKKLKETAGNICSKYVTGNNTLNEDEETTDNEAVRQKEYLEKVVTSLKNQLKQMEKLNKLNSAKMLRDNKVLLNEISLLKKEMFEMRKFKAKLPNINRKSEAP